MLGIPAIYDRVCQQALLNRLEPIFEPVFDDASFGYRRGRSTKDALRKIWKEIQSGSEWIVGCGTSETFWIYLHTAPLFMMNVETGPGWVSTTLIRKAFTPSTPNMNGFEFAALYTLQYGLP